MLRERLMLLTNGKVAIPTTPIGDALKRAPEAAA